MRSRWSPLRSCLVSSSVARTRAGEAVDHLEHAITSAVDLGATSLAADAHEVLADVLATLDRDAEADIHRVAAQRLAQR